MCTAVPPMSGSQYHLPLWKESSSAALARGASSSKSILEADFHQEGLFVAMSEGCGLRFGALLSLGGH